jgi:hypothetical protein
MFLTLLERIVELALKPVAVNMLEDVSEDSFGTDPLVGDLLCTPTGVIPPFYDPLLIDPNAVPPGIFRFNLDGPFDAGVNDALFIY